MTTLIKQGIIDPSTLVGHIYLAADCVDLPHTRRILDRAGDLPITIINGQDDLPDFGPYPLSLSGGKQHLLLTRNRGRFLKPCPGTREYLCCGYQVLNIGMNCPMDCSYCILQAYLNNPWLSFFVNVEDLLAELQAAFERQPARRWRIGTGEFTDSLALDRLTGLSRSLVRFVRTRPNAVLELKTKSAAINNLVSVDPGGRTIVSWSLNATEIMASEEHNTASLEQRLAAAAQCARWGYKLAFHFDPIIFHPAWQEGYAATVQRLFEVVPAEKIVWISMGCLRFLPDLNTIAGRRFPGARYYHEEFICGLDGKSRYFRTQRVELYRHLHGLLVARMAPETCLYLCMEGNEIWQEVFGFVPADRGGLASMLDQAVGMDIGRNSGISHPDSHYY